MNISKQFKISIDKVGDKVRESGILLHFTSLSSQYGIGTLGAMAYEFVDFLCESSIRYWQILPINPTSYGNSPYQTTSAFAGNPYLIDLNILKDNGYLDEEDYININWGNDLSRVDYNIIYKERPRILYKATQKFDYSKEYYDFVESNSYWLDDYALFMALKNKHSMVSFDNWEDAYRLRDEEAINRYITDNGSEIEYHKITQFWFFEQYLNLKRYANSKGIKIIGDIPFYIAYDSADVWAGHNNFDLDNNLKPISVAGVPPDSFSDDGQLWGNPLYNYKYMRKDKYSWWRKRIDFCFKLCDTLRIDHFRAFDSYYTIPFGSKTAKIGEWHKGVGIDFFRELDILDKDIIAEDLGDIDDSVRQFIKECGYPNMKVLQFAYDGKKDNEFLPKNYDSDNCVVYTGTHDNNTTLGWYKNLSIIDKIRVRQHLYDSIFRGITYSLIASAHKSLARLAIIPMQDYLNLGEDARMNMPSTLSGNWEWRILPKQLDSDLANRIRSLVVRYSR